MSTKAVPRPAVGPLRKMIKKMPPQLILLRVGCQPASQGLGDNSAPELPSATRLLGFLVAFGALTLEKLLERGVEVRALPTLRARLAGDKAQRIIKIS